MSEFTIKHAKITEGFWDARLKLNAEITIFHQWQQLEETRCIDNFRIAAGIKKGFREGFFFSDSDAYKWLDAASRILAYDQSPKLKELVDGFIDILVKAQQDDGYLYTYNQIHFGKTRWQSLQVEHEFYCLGHLIEAGISHHKATGEERLFTIAKKAANLLVERFWDAPPKYTDGHEEIEIALIKLSRHTGISQYRELAKRLLERRGKIALYGLRFIGQTLWSAGRMNTVGVLRKEYYQEHSEISKFKLPAHNKHLIPRLTSLRFAASALSGKFLQQHIPLSKQIKPVGHAVRFAYLNTAAAMLAIDEKEDGDIQRLCHLWEHMVTRRMFVSGGIGSLPLIEGFGRDFELDPEVAYNETCAALGCMLWDHEMALLTGEPKYDDLFEWQLYNAALVGVGMDGCSYFYNNPLVTLGGYKRESWYDIPCCPSNLSRVWASLIENAVSTVRKEIRIHQYFGCDVELDAGQKITLHMESGLPWEGMVSLRLEMEKRTQLSVLLRKPAWAGNCKFQVNGQTLEPEYSYTEKQDISACGLDISSSAWLRIDRLFSPGDNITVDFEMPIRLLRQDVRIPKCGGKVAVARGPILYCLESLDNPHDLMNQALGNETLNLIRDEKLLNSIPILKGINTKGENLVFIPYAYWGNRGDSKMTVFLGDKV